MQDFWRFVGIKWTTEAPPEFVKKAIDFENQVRLLTAINIPRWVGTSTNSSTECHIFTDASEIAYGAVAYIKTTGTHGDSSTMLLTSKSRVAPLKTQTIPRLELFGAVVGTNLAAYIRKAFRNELLNIFCWTDSAIVLKWINTEPALLNSFIATRIVQITDCVEASAWRHVKGVENPADILSRGATAAELVNSTLWWNGPQWLKNNSATWTISTEPELSEAEIATLGKETKGKNQQKNSPVALVTTLSAISQGLSVIEKDGEQQSLLMRRSTLNSLLRVTAHVLRFIANIRNSIKLRLSQQSASADDNTPVNASVSDRDQALHYWIGVAQQSAFSKEIKACQSSTQIDNSSKLKTLTPYWDNDRKLLRIRGRLQHSELSPDEKHHLLPAQHPFTALLIRNAHLVTLHGGPQMCISYLRQRFWILNLRTVIKAYIRKECITCKRHAKEPAVQLMGQLPAVRTMPAPPFDRSGVDFAGPFTLRRAKSTPAALRRAAQSLPTTTTTIKVWIVLFVCMISRAVHLDIAKGLTTEAFLDVFARFIARRGHCSQLYADNATTHHGADNVMRQVLKSWGDDTPFSRLADMNTQWNFITPAAPHRGGIWEAGVKAAKHHLKRVLGTRLLTIDELYTLVVQIEATLNSRPLFPMTDDPSDLTYLTPAHLVIGRATLQRPLAENVIDHQDNRLTLWGLQQKMHQQFWSTWKEHFLVELQKTNKWFNPRKNLAVGDMVLIMNETTPPTSWPIGRIEQVHKGADGLIRSATIFVATSKGNVVTTTTLERPIQKLCVLLSDTRSPNVSS